MGGLKCPGKGGAFVGGDWNVFHLDAVFRGWVGCIMGMDGMGLCIFFYVIVFVSNYCLLSFFGKREKGRYVRGYDKTKILNYMFGDT